MKADPPLTPELADVPSPGDLNPPPCRTTIRAILAAVDAHDKKRVVVGGRVTTGCAPSSLLAFIELNDGSCQQDLQAVVKSQVYELQLLTPTGTSVVLEGVLEALDGAKHEQLIELRVEKVIEVGEADAMANLLPKTRLMLDGLTDLWDGGLITPPDGRVEYPASIPRNATCRGSTNEWLLLGICQQIPEQGQPYRHDHYVLHNAFSLQYVPLPELDAVLHREYNIRKFLMRSTIHDFIAVITTNENTPLIVILPGKGVWVPEPREAPYIYIVDIAFLGDKLYAITKAENLIPFDLRLDEDGGPMVTTGKRVIRQPVDYEGYEWWPASDYENSDLDDDEKEEEAAAVLLDVVDDYEEDRQAVDNDEDGKNNINYLNCPHHYISDEEVITWHLVESREKLLMVKPRMHIDPGLFISSIRHVEVFQANFDTGEWVRMANDLGGAQALFIGHDFSKSVSAPCGDVAEGDICFIESGEVFNMKNKLSNLKTFRKPVFYGTCGLWLFPPKLAL